jgi:hypothetical protein
MTSSPHDNVAPRGAAWLISLFADQEETDSILGDLSEESSRLALQSGTASARRWYWRQAVKSVPHLIFSGFLAAPWPTVLAALAGFLLRRLVSRLPDYATFALVDKLGIYPHHFGLYRFLASTALDIEHVLTFLLIGCFVALLARRREMAPAVLLALVWAAMSIVGSVFGAIKSEDYGTLFRLSWYFTDSLAIILGALMVRTVRPHPTAQPVQG